MTKRIRPSWTAAMSVFAVLLFGMSTQLVGQRPAVAVDGDDIGGVVTGSRGPEAGVWRIGQPGTIITG